MTSAHRSLLAISLLCGCGGSKAPAEAPGTEPASSAGSGAAGSASNASNGDATPSDAATANGAAANGAAGAAATSDAPTKPAVGILELCKKMCAHMGEQCSKSTVESCRVNCAQYENFPSECEPHVRAALECAQKAEDVTCSNIAPQTCARKYRRVQDCAAGKPEAAAAAEEVAQLPGGWQRYENKSAGFVTVMPPGVSESAGGKEFKVDVGNVHYAVRLQAPPKDPPTQKNLVKFSMSHLGKCAKKLKLFGMVEKPARTSARYEGECPDGSKRQGLFVILPATMYELVVESPSGMKGEADAFFYGFELLKP